MSGHDAEACGCGQKSINHTYLRRGGGGLRGGSHGGRRGRTRSLVLILKRSGRRVKTFLPVEVKMEGKKIGTTGKRPETQREGTVRE